MADEKVIDLDRLDRYDAHLKTQANILQRNKAYILNQYVCRGNIFLKCIQAGTTDTTTLNLSGVVVGDELTDGTVKWLVIDHFGASGISNWQANKPYAVNDLVIYGNGIYQCITDHTSTSTFDDEKWKNLSIGYEKANLYADTNFQTATTTVTTLSSMLAKDYLIIKMAYSSDGTDIDMNKSFYIVPSIGEVYDLSFVDSATSYAIIRGEIVDATHFKFTFKESVDLTNYKAEIIGVSMASGDSLATSTQIQSLF